MQGISDAELHSEKKNQKKRKMQLNVDLKKRNITSQWFLLNPKK